ncbi:hypothetical protein JCM19240_296 [Vibrio maritimus]|uniref:Uncharacterized protein n=1 Tax=Vibrio maritimus TaxID=990268 RepID=A0A090T9Q1_9VIBR|nr:hypothetical protein JCM19240_296 [Vibrio maritimus]
MVKRNNDILDHASLTPSIIKPAEIVRLPSHMDSHEHHYTQVVIGSKVNQSSM